MSEASQVTIGSWVWSLPVPVHCTHVLARHLILALKGRLQQSIQELEILLSLEFHQLCETPFCTCYHVALRLIWNGRFPTGQVVPEPFPFSDLLMLSSVAWIEKPRSSKRGVDVYLKRPDKSGKKAVLLLVPQIYDGQLSFFDLRQLWNHVVKKGRCSSIRVLKRILIIEWKY